MMSTRKSVGKELSDEENVKLSLTRTSRNTKCNFSATFPRVRYLLAFHNKTIDSCKLVGSTGVSLNVNFCVDEKVN